MSKIYQFGLGDQELLATAVVGTERIALLIARCTVYEQLYFKEAIDIPHVAKIASIELRDSLIALYIAILQVLSRLINLFKSTNPTSYQE